MANNRKCINCGTEYSFCPSCAKDRFKPGWMKLYCSENCKNIFDALNEYFFGNITKEEAIEKLEMCDLSKRDTFNEGIKEDLDKVLSAKKKIKKIEIALTENVDAIKE